jgi:hypothetical protein
MVLPIPTTIRLPRCTKLAEVFAIPRRGDGDVEKRHAVEQWENVYLTDNVRLVSLRLCRQKRK